MPKISKILHGQVGATNGDERNITRNHRSILSLWILEICHTQNTGASCLLESVAELVKQETIGGE